MKPELVLQNSNRRMRIMQKKQPPPSLTKEERARWIWRQCDGVCFDVDSTVCRDEAIDELADYLGVKDEVCAVTKKAMNGSFSFRDALTERLNIIRPTKRQFATYRVQNPPKLTPGIEELVRVLKRKGAQVFLVSGGFASLIVPVAQLLGLPDDHVHANVLHFDARGRYVGFDVDQPTSDSGGKAVVCRQLKERYNLHNLVMVGDGATDMEAYPPADMFIGFGGNQVRESVRSVAPWYVHSFQELIDEIQMPEEQ